MHSEGRYGVERGLVGWWRLMADYGGVSDLIGSNDATLNGANLAGAGGRQFAAFDGVNDYVSIPYSSSLDFSTSPFSASLWVNLDVVNAENYVAVVNGNGQTGTNFGAALFEIVPTGFWFGTHSGTYWVFYAQVPVVSTWYHLAITRSGTSLLGYLNGAQVASIAVPATITNESTTTTIGCRTAAAQHFTDGKISDVRIYNRALSAAEIARLARIY